TTDREIATGARAYLGAAAVRLNEPRAALVRLDTAVVGAREGSDLAAFAYLWRARARFEAADAGAWQDREVAAAIDGAMGREARLEWATRAVLPEDPGRAPAACAGLCGDRATHPAADSRLALAARAAARWGADRTGALVVPVS